MRKGFEKMNSGVVLVIANMSVFLMYFANLYLFDGQEKLPIFQIVLALLFFGIITQFLINKPIKTANIKIKNIERKKIKINKATIYPIITAVARSLFFIGNTYLIKNRILHPSQTQFFTEGTIFIVTIFVFLRKFK
ncbi:MAG: hypothetical protein GXP45_08205 [bacterium]|nr:hypothetical protein [bacterium]